MRILAFALATLASVPAAAQVQAFGETHFVGDTPVDVIARWGDERGRPHGWVDVRAGQHTERVHDGAPAYAWAAASDAGVMVALVGASATVEVYWVPIEGGRPGAAVHAGSVNRLAGAERSPIGASVASRGAAGFSVFWQEASTSNPNATYETYVARFDRAGRPDGPSHRVQAPWPIADVAWIASEGRYYFLLFYGGADPRGTRLCGVHVGGSDDALRNLEHPWWATAPGLIDEARLLVRGSRVTAVYRNDGRLFELDVTQGQWGRDPTATPRAHGAIRASEGFGLRATAQGLRIHRSYLANR